MNKRELYEAEIDKITDVRDLYDRLVSLDIKMKISEAIVDNEILGQDDLKEKLRYINYTILKLFRDQNKIKKEAESE